MQGVTEATVLGDFASSECEHFGVTTTFSRDADKFLVRTVASDGALHEYPIAYTFGVYPLQQYLIAFPGGRCQALGVAWDSRQKQDGGQRWFHLYPDRKLAAGDRLHWTGSYQTWNYQCADCHSTNLQKNYNLAANTYATSWTDVDVSCEACHGPGSRHVAWAKAPAGRGSDDPRMGLTNWLEPTDRGHWKIDPETGIARRTEKPASPELETCAACHSRRKGDRQEPSSWRAISRRLSPCAARTRPLSRRRADRRRGLRIRLVPAEPHACRRGHLLELPRSAQRKAARRGECALPPMPPTGAV